MASDALRRQLASRIFMGDREATVGQLEAMQEPLRREKEQKEEEEKYLERVRARATERARQILGEAYTERQRVLEEVKTLLAGQRQQLQAEYDLLKSQAQAERDQAAADVEATTRARTEAERIRDAAYGEGYQAGQEQAQVELKIFKAELAQSAAAILRTIASQRQSVVESWREELVGLVQAAAAAGTGYVLEKEHETILRQLVLKALSLLEDRATVTVRVNPDDEAAISDLFKAARETAPELSQWIVNGDPDIERGGMVAETSSGSVDSRREYYREMLDGILMHLALPPEADAEEQDEAAVQALLESEVQRIAAMAPMPDVAPAPVAEAAPVPSSQPSPEFSPEPSPEPSAAPSVLQAESLPPDVEARTPVDSVMAGGLSPEQLAALPPDTVADAIAEPDPAVPDAGAEAAQAPLAAAAVPSPAAAQKLAHTPVRPEELQPNADPTAWLPPLETEKQPEPQAAPLTAPQPESNGYAGTAAAFFDATPVQPQELSTEAASAQADPSAAAVAPAPDRGEAQAVPVDMPLQAGGPEQAQQPLPQTAAKTVSPTAGPQATAPVADVPPASGPDTAQLQHGAADSAADLAAGQAQPAAAVMGTAAMENTGMGAAAMAGDGTWQSQPVSQTGGQPASQPDSLAGGQAPGQLQGPQSSPAAGQVARQVAGQAAGGAAGQAAGQSVAQTAQTGNQAAQRDDPSLQELEEELFPLDANEREVLAGGGFLPGPHEKTS